MQLYIMRHGQAATPDGAMESELTRAGRLAIEQLAVRFSQSLSQQGLSLSTIFHSGKKRAEQTANIMAKSIIANTGCSILAGMRPNDDPQNIIETINHWQAPTLIVSHLPFIPRLGEILAGSNAEVRTIDILPGTIITLQPSNHHWQIVSIMSP